jgi:thiamine pyrophosphate-dependent acetolactate synthase large subunit-like protein
LEVRTKTALLQIGLPESLTLLEALRDFSRSPARDHAPVLCIVDDGSAMYSPQAAKEHGFLAMDLCHPKVDFQSLAKSMGVAATLVNAHQNIADAVEAALLTGKPHLIEIPVTGVA